MIQKAPPPEKRGNPDEKGEWLKIKGGWWEYKLWIKGNESAATWAKFTDAGMLNTNLYAEVGNTAKSYGSAFVKDTSKVDYGNAHNGKTDGDIYVTAERIWCGNLDAFVVSHSLNAHSSATLTGIESGDLSSRVMQILTELAPEIEIYSIDEAFVEVSGIKNTLSFF